MKLIHYKLEKDIESTNELNRDWLKQSLAQVLESNKDVTTKADYIGLSLLGIDAKIEAINEEIFELKELQTSLANAKQLASEIGAELFSEYDIEKLEGLRVSSLTIHNPVITPKVNFEVLNPQALIDAGFRKEVLDMAKLKECYNNGEYLELIHAHAQITLQRAYSPKRLKVNKKRKANHDMSYEELKDVS